MDDIHIFQRLFNPRTTSWRQIQHIANNITVPLLHSCVNILKVTVQHEQHTAGSLLLSRNMLTTCEAQVIKCLHQ